MESDRKLVCCDFCHERPAVGMRVAITLCLGCLRLYLRGGGPRATWRIEPEEVEQCILAGLAADA